MPKRNPRSRIADKLVPLITELGRLGFGIKVEMNTDNEGKLEWKKRPVKEEDS